MMLLAGVGGSLGAASRYIVGIWLGKKMGKAFPFSTLFINVAGSFLLGILTSLNMRGILLDWAWFLFGIGYCGAFTTFSTFGYETIQLFLSKNRKDAAIYIASSVLVSILAALLGMVIAS